MGVAKDESIEKYLSISRLWLCSLSTDRRIRAQSPNSRSCQGDDLTKSNDSKTEDAVVTPTSQEFAALASMSYLHSIALVLTSGVVAGLIGGVGLVLAIVFEAAEFAALAFSIAAALGIAFLISSLVALVRADHQRSGAMAQSTLDDKDPLVPYLVTLVTDDGNHMWKIGASDPEAALLQAMGMMPSTKGLFTVWDPKDSQGTPLAEHDRTED